MSQAWVWALGVIATIGPARADWKITTATTDMRGGESVGTEYYKGKLHRTDVDWPHRSVLVVDLENLRETVWDPSAKQYMLISLNRTPHPTLVAERDSQTRPILLFESNTTDTGERQMFFGRTARHLITSEKEWRQESPGAESKSEGEKVTDGWYIDVSGLPQSRFAGAIVTLSFNGEMPVMKETHTGAKLSGLAVREKMTSRFGNSGSATPEFESSTEVRELSDGVLPVSVFEPPSDYQRVAELANPYAGRRSFGDEVEAYWNAVERWFLNWLS